MKQSLKKMRLELTGSELTDATMRKRFQTFARMLLYFLENIERYFYHEAGAYTILFVL
jgi:hypothetical protein